MTIPSPPDQSNGVLYSVRDFGGFSGGQLSPLDWLHALADLEVPTTVMSRSQYPKAALPALGRGSIQWQRVKLLQNGPLATIHSALRRPFEHLAVRKLKPSVVISEGRNGHKLADRFRVRGRCANALVVRGQPSQYSEDVAGQDRLASMIKAISVVDTVIFNAKRVQKDWEAIGALVGKRCLIVPNTAREEEVAEIHCSQRADVRAELGFESDALVIVCVASIQYRKGQDLLLDAWPQVKSAFPNAQLHLVGPVANRGGGPTIAERAAGMDGVVMTGPRRDALRYVFASDLLVLPSRGESMPRVVLEAMALGTPVAVSKVGAVPEMIEHKVGGLLFEQDDVEGMTSQILKLAQSRSLRLHLAENARLDYWKRFSRDNQREHLRAAIESMQNIGTTQPGDHGTQAVD